MRLKSSIAIASLFHIMYTTSSQIYCSPKTQYQVMHFNLQKSLPLIHMLITPDFLFGDSVAHTLSNVFYTHKTLSSWPSSLAISNSKKERCIGVAKYTMLYFYFTHKFFFNSCTMSFLFGFVLKLNFFLVKYLLWANKMFTDYLL